MERHSIKDKFNYYTNGINTIKVYENDDIPEGYYKGRTFKSNPWNKGLTAETDERVKNNGQSTRETRISNGSYISWNKGLTKETNSSLKTVSEKVSNYRKGKTSWNKGISKSDSSKKKQSITMKNLYSEGKIVSWNKGLTKETSSIMQSISEKAKNREKIIIDWKKAKLKEYETRKTNGTLNNYLSKGENNLYNILINIYGKDDIYRQYFSAVYPFKCDFYIKSCDLYIEYNGTWTHGVKPFDQDDDDCQNVLLKWQENAKTSKYYESAIYTWTNLDKRKIETAKNNKLNFIAIYPKSKILVEIYNKSLKPCELLENLNNMENY